MTSWISSDWHGYGLRGRRGIEPGRAARVPCSMAEELDAAFRRFWHLLGGHGPIPGGQDSVAVFLSIVRAGAGERLWVRKTQVDDPGFFETLARVPDPYAHRLDLAIAAANLVPIECAALTDVVMLVDPRPDERGHHRVYAHDVEALPGQPFDWWFADSSAALAFMERAIGGQDARWPAATPDDEWERSPRSGRFVLERVLEADLSFGSNSRTALDELFAVVAERHARESPFLQRFGGYLRALAAG